MSTGDDQAAAWAALAAEWWLNYGDSEVPLGKLFGIAKTIDGMRFGKKDSEQAERTSFGMQLKNKRDVTLAPLWPDPKDPKLPEQVQIVRVGTARAGGWKLVRVD